MLIRYGIKGDLYITSFVLSGKTIMTQLKTLSPKNKASLPNGKYGSELRQAISDTSGFKRWVLDRQIEPKSAEGTTDAMVQLYLRQALETLAY
jgi:predicted fused transcriptional regulator/phosphomethylpyrimidine kinase